MEIITLAQIIIAIGLVNVWIVRFHKPTQYRGRGAENMEQEFHAYGLPTWFMYCIGGAKLVIAAAMVIGLWIPTVVVPAALILAVLMIGAIAMHIKVRDRIVKALPAMGMLALALVILLIAM